MRTIVMFVVAAMVAASTAGSVEAAKSERASAHARHCDGQTGKGCKRVARRHVMPAPVAVAGPVLQAPPGDAAHMLPGQLYPDRPYGAAPDACFTDDGGGRFRPCSAGDTSE